MDSIPPPTGYWLTRIRLYNWHAFDKPREIKLTFGKGLHLEGDTGVGKTTLLDAILWALIGDENKIRFNASAGESGSRTLKGYYRWLDQATDSYRRDHGIAHVLLEFTHALTLDTVTVGSLIEYEGENRSVVFLVAKLPLTLGLVMLPDIEGKGFRPLNIKQLRQVEKRHRDNDEFFVLIDTAREYRERLAQLFGNLNPHYFDVLNRVLGSEPRNLDVFIRSVLFTEEQIDPVELRDRVLQMREAESELAKAKDRLAVVRRIHDEHQEWQRKLAQVLVYDACAKQLKLDWICEGIQTRESTGARTEREIAELETKLAATEAAELEAQNEYVAAINSRNLDGRSQEINRLLEEAERRRAEVEHVGQQLAASSQALKELREWIDPLIQAVRILANVTDNAFPQAASLIRAMAFDAQVDSLALTNHLSDLLSWLGGTAKTLSDRRKQYEASLAEYSEALQQGRFSDRYLNQAQRVQARLSQQVGPIRLLFELVESVDPAWQGIVERLLGNRRFTFIPTQDQWEACQQAFRALPPEQADGLHLVQPATVLHLNHSPRADSLAAVVTTDDPLARGLLNLHLERFTLCDTDDVAVHATRPVVTRSGLVVSGGTIERRRPLDSSQCIFGEPARRAQLERMRSESTRLEREIRTLNEYQGQLGQLQAGTKRVIEQVPSIQPQLSGKLEQLKTDHAHVLANVQTLQATPNILELGERVERAQQRQRGILETIGGLKAQIEAKRAGFEENARQLMGMRNERGVLETAVAALDNDPDWRPTYTALRQLGESWGTLIERALFERNRYEGESTQQLQIINERVARFIEMNYPRAVLETPEAQLKLCLEEYDNLNQTMRLEQLTERVSTLRFDAEQVLLRSFIDRLHRYHKSIDSIMRDLNRTISVVPFARRRYKFVKEPVALPLVRDTLDLLRRYDELQAERMGIDMTDQLRRTHAALIDRLFRVLVPDGQSAAEVDQNAVAVLTVPVKYFRFDLHASEDNGPEFSLSQHYTRGSGGERQLPVYIILAAAMRHFYSQENGQLHPERPRLVLMDEAFNKAPMHAVEGLSLILEQGLQPLVSTPIGRPEVEEVIGHTKHVFIDARSHQVFVDDISKNQARFDSLTERA